MTFHEKFVAVVTHGPAKKILREQDGRVLLPFGSEYGLQLKNQNSRRAVVSITIDGTDVLQGQRIIVEPNETAYVDGFLGLDGKVTNRFKFIEKTAQISNFRGDKIEDGSIRIEFQFEAEKPEVKYTTTYHRHETYGWGHWYYPYPYSTPVWRGGDPRYYVSGHLHDNARSASNHYDISHGCRPKSYNMRDITKGVSDEGPDAISSTSLNSFDPGAMSGNVPISAGGAAPCQYGGDNIRTLTEAEARAKRPHMYDDTKTCASNGGRVREMESKTSAGIKLPDREVKDGITVKGSASDQMFKYGTVGTLEVNKHVIVINLAGSNDRNEPVTVAVETKKKVQCETCGRHCKTSNKFCPNCGTALF